MEILDRPSLTESAGAHPLFNGVRRVTIAGLPTEPAAQESAGKLTIKADGVTAELEQDRVERRDRSLAVRLK